MAMKAVNRRTFLKASGIAMALPMLESMSLGSAAAASAPPRLVNICATLGLYSDSWFPKTGGADWTPSEYLSIINHHRDRFTVFSGLAHAHQSGRQAHNSEISWLTSAQFPGLDGFRNTISLDQVVADHYGYVTRFPSIILGTNSPQSQSYTSGGVMLPADTSPAQLFSKLFLKGSPEAIAQETQRLSEGGSILDHLKSQAQSMLGHASAADRAKLDEYFTAVRTCETNLVEVRAWQDRPKPTVSVESPTDIQSRADIVGRTRLMLELIPLVLETDSSRVASLMIQDHGVVPTVPGVSADQHNLSHHGRDVAKIAQLRMVETALITEFGKFLDRMTQPGVNGESLLDSTVVLLGSNLGNANSHKATDLPILVAGGPFKHGKHIVHEGENAPLSNLFLTILQATGIETDSFGHSTSPLIWT